jgi:hypothetical protein
MQKAYYRDPTVIFHPAATELNQRDPTLVYAPAGVAELGFDLDIGGMLSNIVSSVVAKMPDVATEVVTAVAKSKLTSALTGKTSSGGKSSGSKPAPSGGGGGGGGQELMVPGAAPAKGLPGWVLPVAIGVGALLLIGGIVVVARRK